MSIESVGFNAFDTLFPNQLFRLTLSESSLDLLNQFSKGSAQALFNNLYPVAKLIPTVRLALVNGDSSAVIDANLKEECQGAQLLNRLEQAGVRFAFVSKIELLSQEDRQKSSSEDGQQQRTEQKADADKKQEDDSLMGKVGSFLATLGTVGKYAAIGLGAAAVLYLFHRSKE